MRRPTKPVKVPLIPQARAILEKYELGGPNEGFLPISSNQKTNAYLKEIANECGIDKNLTFHVARHTFATTVMLSNNVSIETVSKLLRHTKLSTTQIYTRVVESKISEDIDNLSIRFKSKEVERNAVGVSLYLDNGQSYLSNGSIEFG